MWLEDSCDMTALIDLSHALCTLVYLLRMVCIIREEDVLCIANAEIEATVNALVYHHTIANLIGSASIQLCHCHRCDAIVDVDRHWLSEVYACDILYRRDKVEGNLSVLYLYILCMEVSVLDGVGICAYTFLHIRLHLQSFVDDESAPWLDESGVMAE